MPLRHVPGLVLAVTLMLPAPASAAGLYRWTDADGKLHISDRPPEQGVSAQPMAAPKAQSLSGTGNAATTDVDQQAYADAQRKRLLEAGNKAEAQRKAREREQANQRSEADASRRKSRQDEQQAAKCKRLKQLADQASGFEVTYQMNCR